MLLTFKNIRNEAGKGNDVFDQSVSVLTDLATKMGTDPKKAAIQLGKALNDPVKGVTALTKVGVTFDAGQQKQIATLVKHNKTLDAQKIIIKELNSEFGGQAAAQGTPLDKLHVSVGNLQESIGSGLQPVTDKLFTSLKGEVDQVIPITDRLGKSISKIFGRDDLTLQQKLGMTGRDAQRAFGPVVDDLQAKLKQLLGGREFGDALGEGFEAAAPYIADHAAHSAPVVAKAFVNSWLHADVWGKLLTLGFVAGKLGAFRLAGGIAADRFATSFSNKAPAEIEKRQGKISKGLHGTSLAIGKAMGGVMAYEIAHELAMQVPALAQYSGSKGFGELARDLADDVTGGPDSEARRAARRGNTAPAGTRPTHVGPARQTILGQPTTNLDVHTTVKLDGEPVAKSVDRQHLKSKGRG
jgi:hypothetical protein